MSLDTSALVRVKLRSLSESEPKAFRARKIPWLAARRIVGPFVSGFCVDGTGTPRHYVTGSVVGSGRARAEEVITVTLLGGTSFVGYVTVMYSADLDRDNH